MDWVQSSLETVDPRAALSAAIRRDDRNAVRRLLVRHGDVLEAPNAHGIRPLYEAVRDGSATVTRELIQHGARLHAPQGSIHPLAPPTAWGLAMRGPTWSLVQVMLEADGITLADLAHCARDLEQHGSDPARDALHQVRARLRDAGEEPGRGGPTGPQAPRAGRGR